MRKLNNHEVEELIKSYEMTYDLSTHEKTSYSLIIKDERTGAYVPYQTLTKSELMAVLEVLDPHGFFSGHSWYREEEEK